MQARQSRALRQNSVSPLSDFSQTAQIVADLFADSVNGSRFGSDGNFESFVRSKIVGVGQLPAPLEVV